MDKPLLSVIIANYNHGKYIEQCLRSVMDSDVDPYRLEIIIVDDASTDGSVAIIESIIPESNTNIRLLQNDTNTGAARARNRGIANAKGTYVFFMDADDYLHKQCLRQHFDFLSHHPEFIACFAPQQEFSNSTGELLNVRSDQPFDYSTLLKGPYISGVALFRTRELMDAGMYNVNMPPYGWIDYELWLRLGKMGRKVHLLKGEPLYYYRIHTDSITGKIDFHTMKLLIDYLRKEHPLEYDIRKDSVGKIEYFSVVQEAQLFLSNREEDSQKLRITDDTHHFEFTLSPPRNIKTLRFDPINDFALVKINSFGFQYLGQPIGKPVKITSNALNTENDQLLFHTTDPQVYFELPAATLVDAVTINISYLKTGTNASLEILQIEHQQKLQLEKQAAEMKAIIQKNKVDINQLTEERNANYLQSLETLAQLVAIHANPVNRGLIKVGNLLGGAFRIKLLRKVLDKIQLLINTRTLSRSGLFDRDFYTSTYPDVAGSGIRPEKHFLQYGWKEGRNPSENFDTSYYLSNNRDVLAQKINPLIHYIKKGRYENRAIRQGIQAGSPLMKNGETEKTMFQFIKGRQKIEIPHFAPPKHDFALETPFAFQEFNVTSPGKIAVFCHIFYADLIAEIKDHLSNIPFSFDLFVSTNTADKQHLIYENFEGWSKGNLKVEVTENRGRDIAPKLITWHRLYSQYDYCLHIHTKKSLQENVLSNWRQYLYENLTGSEKTVRSIFEAFHSDPQLGMIAANHFTDTRQAVGWGYNFETASYLAKKMGITITKEGRVNFPSGSMFWARTKALRPLLDLHLKFDDFPEESGQTDGTPAHAIERLFFFTCEKAGYKWINIINPATSPYPQRSLTVEKPHQLPAMINQVQTELLSATGQSIATKKVSDSHEISRRLHFLKIHQASPYAHLDPETFIQALQLHIAGKESLIDFDESFYLKANPDIEKLVLSGVFECGFIHFCLSGQKEKRVWSNGRLQSKFGVRPWYPKGMFEPVNVRTRRSAVAGQVSAVKSPERFMLILFGHLQSDLFYAGYRAFFEDFLPVFDHFPKITIAVDSEHTEPELATQYCSRIEVIKQRDIHNIAYSPDVVVCFSNHQVTKALQLFRNPEKIVYYCQEFESGFFPYGTQYIEAESAIAQPKNLIISTELLKAFLEEEKLITGSNIFVTSHEIEALSVAPEKTGKLFFYFRPEYFHTRNLPEKIWEAVHEFCQLHSGFELYLSGSVETRFSMEINGNAVYVINKLPKEEYTQLLASCDAAVAMIYSAHPGVIAFQAAASGIPTITNIFKNRSAQKLKAISENLIPFDPVRENLSMKLEEALQKKKGRKHFNRDLFSGPPQPVSLTEFVLQIANFQ
jgi:glycosyltransferase involved in cell wall biosynthesis